MNKNKQQLPIRNKAKSIKARKQRNNNKAEANFSA